MAAFIHGYGQATTPWAPGRQSRPGKFILAQFLGAETNLTAKRIAGEQHKDSWSCVANQPGVAQTDKGSTR